MNSDGESFGSRRVGRFPGMKLWVRCCVCGWNFIREHDSPRGVMLVAMSLKNG